MRLLVVITTLGVGGAEAQAAALVQSVRRRGWEPAVVSLLEDDALSAEIRDEGIPVMSLGMRRGVPDPRAIFQLARLIRSHRPQVVHAHMVHANLLARAARVMAPVPVLVCTAHSVDEEGRLREWAYRLTDGLCDLLTNVSRHATARYAALRLAAPGKLRCVPNGIDLERFRPDPTDRDRLRESLGWERSLVWLAVGRLAAPKDPGTLIRAFEIHAKRFPDAVLAMAGDGPLRPHVEQLIRDHGLASRVFLLGTRRDVPALMNAADAFVLSSLWEGLPMVALEAAASALPVVATAVGGTDEVVLGGRTGILVPPRNTARLAEALTAMATMPASARHAMGQAARGHVAAHYELEAVADQWEGIYRELLGRSRDGVAGSGLRRDGRGP